MNKIGDKITDEKGYTVTLIGFVKNANGVENIRWEGKNKSGTKRQEGVCMPHVWDEKKRGNQIESI